MDGLLVLDKPAGPTSHDVVARMRRVLGESRIGHTGTLDPLATGVLPLVIGRATRLAQFLSASNKEYAAVVRLGVETDTRDAAGTPIGDAYSGALPPRATIERELNAFRGTFDQQPPSFSAKKIDGTRSYRLARGQSPVQPAPVSVTAHAIEIVSVEGAAVTLRIACSAGFYVRALAHDLGRALGTGAHLAALRRTASGPFTLADALPLDEAERDPAAARARIVPMRSLLGDLPVAPLTPDGVQHAMHGRALGAGDFAEAPGRGPRVRLLSPAGELVGIASPAPPPALLHPSIILM